MRRDPACQVDVNEATAEARSNYAGDTYYFCSQQCKERFDADPEKYVSRSEHSQT